MNKNNSPWIALIIVLTAPFLSVIDVFIVNVAIPSIKKGIHANDGQIQLVIAGYLLGYASFLITGGRAGDQFGRKKVFFWGMLGFTLFSCFCGLAQTPFQLNVTRFFQGISASFMVPQSISFIQILFRDAKDRAKAVGLFGITLGVGSIVGQFLGGYLSETHLYVDGWRLIFFINLPIGIAALWTAHYLLSETAGQSRPSFDFSGVGILTAALICLIYPLAQGRELGWPLWSISIFILSLLFFSYFIYDQQTKLKKGKSPLIDFALFRNRDFSIGLIAVLFHFMMHTSFLLTSAVFLQSGLGIPASMCGLYFVLLGLLFTLSSLAASKLLDKYGKAVPLFGILIISVSFVCQIFMFKANVSNLTLFSLIGIYGLGNGLVLPSLLNLALSGVPQKFAGAAAGVYSTFQQTASALGVCIIGGIFYGVARVGPGAWDYTKGYRYSSGANVICMVFTMLMLIRLPGKKTLNPEHILTE